MSIYNAWICLAIVYTSRAEREALTCHHLVTHCYMGNVLIANAICWELGEPSGYNGHCVLTGKWTWYIIHIPSYLSSTIVSGRETTLFSGRPADLSATALVDSELSVIRAVRRFVCGILPHTEYYAFGLRMSQGYCNWSYSALAYTRHIGGPWEVRNPEGNYI